MHPLNLLIARFITSDFLFLVSITVFLWVALSYKGQFFIDLDKKTNEWAMEINNQAFKKFLDDCTILGNAILHIAFSIVLSIVFYTFKEDKKTAIAILVVLIFSWGFNRFLKLVFKRERPTRSSNEKKRRSYCFPSGHVMASIPIYFFSAMVLQPGLTFLPLYLIALLVSVLVILPRIVLRHHFLTDVLAGAAMGVICLKAGIYFYFL